MEPLAAFITNPAGAAVVQAVGHIRSLVLTEEPDKRRYPVVVSGSPAELGDPIQIQTEE